MKYLLRVYVFLLMFIHFNIVCFNQHSASHEINAFLEKKREHMEQDFIVLSHYFEAIFNGLAKESVNKNTFTPSKILFFLRDNHDLSKSVPLQHMSLSAYLEIFISDEQCKALDIPFENKYNSTRDMFITWQWFSEYFRDNLLRHYFDAYAKNDSLQYSAL